MCLYASRFISRLLQTSKLGNFKYLLLLVVALVALPSCTFGQTATIVGTVTDPSGAVVPNVAITVTNTATSVSNSVSTNDAGQYVVPEPAP